ncbi:RecQ family ATP-dependent DNA helicase [Desulfosediminicola sp.]|uniref:RecQ family ATP-dependent DNA helicase n=1 Tax=Desulfosediminicola sp. TaxID=2886825 RepID=UPI003AF26B6D
MTEPELQNFLNRCLLLDIEINEKGKIYALGAVFRDETIQVEAGQKIDSNILAGLDGLSKSADFVLGHNIIAHDIPQLAALYPQLALLKKQLVDTLYISPLAYPENPYHRLVKDYQIVRDSVNDPVADARLAARIFREQWQVLGEQIKSGAERTVFYRNFLERDSNLVGTARALAAMSIPRLDDSDLPDAFAWFAKKYACSTAVERLLEQLHDADFYAPQLAYVVAWLSVAGGNSVLPPWVRHRFPEISAILHSLRESCCEDPACSYCRKHHNPGHFLQTYFGFKEFRPTPATKDGKSLQGEIVSAAASSATLFATLPTGGGKSLCYLLPALMRYTRRNLLTIVISPLQALMKDQVDNFSESTGTKLAAALYGMLTMPERSEVLDSIRLGDIGILYVSPEQLRNRSFVQTIKQREIGAWVFDEAHCMSKWGHDFRPDYFYAVRFIRELAGKTNSQIPPVQCFTATAKKDVRQEIIDTVQSELGLQVLQYEGGHERTNLNYEVYSVDSYGKGQVIIDLLRSRYEDEGSVVIYCATRKNTETLAADLQKVGYTVEAFHAGLDVSLKKRIQEQFITGELPVICATNAFGMGIDKDDVRLVIHADIPGSLENYLQEAGRAGRDRKAAECILVFDEQDIEGQFRLGSMSRLTRREIAQMLRGIRAASRGEQQVILTAGELLRRDDVDIDPDKLNDADSRVRTAIAWLERAGFIKRDENETRVFQGKPLVKDLEEAAGKIAGLNLSKRQEQRWLDVLSALMESGSNRGFSADELAGMSSFATAENDNVYETETQRVLRTLHDMAEQGVLSKETTLSAYLRYKVKNGAPLHLQRLCELERQFIRLMEENAPEVETETFLQLDLRQINQQLLDCGNEDTTPHVLKLILYGLSRDGKGLAGQAGSITTKSQASNCFSIYLHRDWDSLKKTVEIRQQASQVALRSIMEGINDGEKPNGSLLVEFTLEQIVEAFKRDLLLFPLLKDPLAAAERTLTFMHEQGVIDLQHGLAIFNQAMTLQLQSEGKGRRYTNQDFSPLKTHYTERNFQIHVMNEYARKAMEKVSSAMRLVSSYFNDDKEEFVMRYFPGREKMLDRATSQQSYQRIVDDLKNKAQAAIVSAPAEKNMLVLAGPGAGKTRVVTHRVAYLLRVERVKPQAILVLCFNHSAAVGLRKKLRDLVGNEMAHVTTLTYHGLALRLSGRSLATAGRTGSGEIDFGKIIPEAIALLKGETEALGFESISARDALIGRFSHILVDEYQDIDAGQYELVSLLAGRTLQENEQKMTILAVGDDDQNIYGFRGTNVGFIRRFEEDFTAEKKYLIENYRSTANIISAANSLITHSSDRMKGEHPIKVNSARRMLPVGGNYQINDPIARGKVQIFEVENAETQARAAVEEIRRLQSLEGHFDLNNCAVLGRNWKDLALIRSTFEAEGIAVNFNWGRSGNNGFPGLSRIRENAVFLEQLRLRRTESLRATDLFVMLPDCSESENNNLWLSNLRSLLTDWQEETANTGQPVSVIEDYLYEALSEQGRSRNLGSGVFLSTVHSVKGMEFDHVFMLGNGWQFKQGNNEDEERRLYYVGMSRARQTLQLFSLPGGGTSFAGQVQGDSVIKRTIPATDGIKLPGTSYHLLGMRDLDLGFGGRLKSNHPTLNALPALKPGDSLGMEIRNDHVEMVNSEGVSVARLSRKARAEWSKWLNEVRSVTVVALVKRYKSDVKDEEYLKYCLSDVWEVVVCEVQRQESG